MKNILASLLLAAALLGSSCLSIPDQPMVIEKKGGLITSKEAQPCDAVGMANVPPFTTDPKQFLDSKRFSLLVWNLHKGREKGWQDDLQRFSLQRDILILQEAFYREDIQQVLQDNLCQWHLNVAFTYGGIEYGVLTATRVEPDYTCALRHAEPMIAIPKTVLITRYRLSGSEQALMIVNSHMINFALDTASYRAQLEKILNLISNHKGPLIVAGDFNTWNDQRRTSLTSFTLRLNLKPVKFNEDYQTRVFGNAVDHIFYRGLELQKATAEPVTSSDHNPLTVTFGTASNTEEGGKPK